MGKFFVFNIIWNASSWAASICAKALASGTRLFDLAHPAMPASIEAATTMAAQGLLFRL
jgi:hypothetical protein